MACNAAALILIWPMGGLFSCLIGLTAVLLTGYLPLGAVLIPAAFILPAFLEYGPESGFLTVLMTFIMLRQHARPPEYDFGYGEEGGFAGDAEVRKL